MGQALGTAARGLGAFALHPEWAGLRYSPKTARPWARFRTGARWDFGQFGSARAGADLRSDGHWMQRDVAGLPECPQ